MKKEIEKKKQRDRLRWGGPLAVTSLMIILIVAVSFLVIHHINHMEEEKSFERLYEEADSLADMIETYAKGDRETLETLAAVAATYDDMHSEELWELLDSCSNVGMITKIEMLLPDNTVLGRGGERVATEKGVSFESEAARGSYITDREADTEDSEKYTVRQCVPVYRDSQVIAILRGVISLSDLTDEMNLTPYGGKAAMYIVDGANGDFLIDTWHPGEGGNIWGLGEREMAPGYESDQLKKGIVDGERGYVVFVSKTIGEYLYFYYQPMEINEWRIAVSVPESVVLFPVKGNVIPGRRKGPEYHPLRRNNIPRFFQSSCNIFLLVMGIKQHLFHIIYVVERLKLTLLFSCSTPHIPKHPQKISDKTDCFK